MKRKSACTTATKRSLDKLVDNTILKKKIHSLEVENNKMRLQEVVDESSTTVTKISARKDRKTFSTAYRKAGYCCILNQVPVEATAVVISTIVKEMTGCEVDAQADPSTVSQFAYELGILNDIQVGEALVDRDNLNIAWDATSLDAEHINEVHINFPGDSPKGLMLQIDTLPGRTALDYVTHITQSLNDVTDTYALCNNIDLVQLHAATVTKVKSTVSGCS